MWGQGWGRGRRHGRGRGQGRTCARLGIIPLSSGQFGSASPSAEEETGYGAAPGTPPAAAPTPPRPIASRPCGTALPLTPPGKPPPAGGCWPGSLWYEASAALSCSCCDEPAPPARGTVPFWPWPAASPRLAA